MANENITAKTNPSQEPAYQVTINDHVVFESTGIGLCITHAWELCHNQDIPAAFVDIKAKNDFGLWVTIWAENRSEGGVL